MCAFCAIGGVNLSAAFWGGNLLKVGLTGGIASGKSAVGEMFIALGAHLIQADSIAHQLMHPGHPVYDEIVRHFGPGILNLTGTINRPKLPDPPFDPRPAPAKKPT